MEQSPSPHWPSPSGSSSSPSSPTTSSSGRIFAPRDAPYAISIFESSSSDEEWQARAEAALQKVITPKPGTIRVLKSTLRKARVDQGEESGIKEYEGRSTVPRRVNFRDTFEESRPESDPPSPPVRQSIYHPGSDDVESDTHSSEIASPVAVRTSIPPALPFPRSGSHRTPAAHRQLLPDPESSGTSSDGHFAQRLVPLTTQVHSPPASAESRKLWQADAFRSASLSAKAFDHWYSSTHRLGNEFGSVVLAHDAVALNRALASWRSRFEIVVYRDPVKAEEFSDWQCLSNAFSRWKETVGGYHLYADALQIEKERTLGPIIRYWRERCLLIRKERRKRLLQESSSSLLQKYNHDRLCRVFTTWRGRSRELRAQAFDETRLLQTDFAKWWAKIRHIMRLRRALENIEAREAAQSTRQVLERWRRKASLLSRERQVRNNIARHDGLESLRKWKAGALRIRLANATYDNTIIKAAYASWRLRYQKCHYLHVIEVRYQVAKTTDQLCGRLEFWSVESRSRQHERAKSTRTLHRFLNHWRARYKYIELDLGGAADAQIAILDGSLLRRALQMCRQRLAARQALEAKGAELGQKSVNRKAFGVWHNHLRDLRNAEEYASQIHNCAKKARSLQVWHRAALHNKLLHSTSQKTCVRRVMKAWRHRRARILAMQTAALTFEAKRDSTIRGETFAVWSHQQEKHEIFRSRAIRYDNKHLKRGHFDKWIEFAEYLSNLKMLAESCEYISAKAFMRTSLRTWQTSAQKKRGLQSIEERVVTQGRKALLIQTWDIWQAQITFQRMRPAVEQFTHKLTYGRKKTMMQRWKERSGALEMISDRRREILLKAFGDWGAKAELASARRALSTRTTQAMLKKSFVKWIASYGQRVAPKDKIQIVSNHLMVKAISLSHWRRQTKVAREQLKKAESQDASRLSLQTLTLWYDRWSVHCQYSSLLTQYQDIVNARSLKSAFRNWKSRLDKFRGQIAKADSLRVESLSYAALRIWVEAYCRENESHDDKSIHARDHRAMSKATIADHQYDHAVQRRAFTRWAKQYRAIQVKAASADRHFKNVHYHRRQYSLSVVIRKWKRKCLIRQRRHQEMAREQDHMLRTLEIRFLRYRLRVLADKALAQWRRATDHISLAKADNLYDKTLLTEGWRLWRHRSEDFAYHQGTNTLDRLARTVEPRPPQQASNKQADRLIMSRQDASKEPERELAQPSHRGAESRGASTFQDRIAKYFLLRTFFRTWQHRLRDLHNYPVTLVATNTHPTAKTARHLQSERRQRLSRLNMQLQSASVRRGLIFDQ